MAETTNFVQSIEEHQHRKIACLEEIAFRHGWITREDIFKAAETMENNQYGQYLKNYTKGKYIDPTNKD